MILAIAALFAAILSARLSFRIVYRSSAEESLVLYAKIGFFKISIMPQKPKKEKKEKKAKKKKEKPKKPKKEKKAEPPKEKKKYSASEIFDFVKELGTELLKRFRKHLCVKLYKIEAIISSEEAEKTALAYGVAIQSAYYLLEFLEQNFKIKRKPDSIKIIPDFSRFEPSIGLDIKFYMALSHMAAIGIGSAMKFLKFAKRRDDRPRSSENRI
ncbi:MAG: DUF2953 domain-containing protein [Oscillospiraceae bacterium]|nr:DUF2953 domain-containing protein [Oscillospiraceae bacterium]